MMHETSFVKCGIQALRMRFDYADGLAITLAILFLTLLTLGRFIPTNQQL